MIVRQTQGVKIFAVSTYGDVFQRAIILLE